MRILISGATGLIGRSLNSALREKGHETVRLARISSEGIGKDDLVWDLSGGSIPNLEGFDGVVHLAGELIGIGRWSSSKKRKIHDSRITSTRVLSEALAALSKPPRVFVCASAVGYYGDRGSEILTEESSPGTGFLAEVCVEWEKSTEAAERAGIRVVNVRTSFVTSPRSPQLKTMKRLFKLGLGGKVGSGNQYISWIDIEDITRIYLRALEDDESRGPINAASPNPVTNVEFTKTLGRVLSRPSFFTVPRWLSKLLLGTSAQELLLSSQRVEPRKLLDKHFEFRYARIEDSLRKNFGK